MHAVFIKYRKNEKEKVLNFENIKTVLSGEEVKKKI